MGFRFFKRIKIAPGLTMNLSKSGASFSFGPRGMKYTVGAKGTRTTFGIPGTGLYYTQYNKKGNKQQCLKPTPLPETGFLKQIFASPEEKNLIQGIKRFLEGDQSGAYNILLLNNNSVDSQFMCGFIALGNDDYSKAEGHFNICKARAGELGRIIQKISGDLEMLLEVTEFIEAPVHVDTRGLALAMVEAYQGQNKYQQALHILTDIWNQNPADKVILLSLTDLIANSHSATIDELKDIAELTADIENEEPIDTNILYLRAYVLYRLGLSDAAIKLMGALTRRKKHRPQELLLCARYMRGRMYEEAGQLKKANKDYQAIYAEEPRFEDVSARLGLN
ncbi:DUF4236 domain-containing protein [Peptococcaceae bacterium 1198_IL3148]